jgi:hypothetical protein
VLSKSVKVPGNLKSFCPYSLNLERVENILATSLKGSL